MDISFWDMTPFLYSPHETPRHPDRWWGPSGAGGRTGGRSHEPTLCSLRYSVRGERMLASASDRDTVDPHWDEPAVSVSSLATRHLLLISSCGKTKALICLGSSTNILCQIRPCFLSFIPPFRWRNMQGLKFEGKSKRVSRSVLATTHVESNTLIGPHSEWTN